MTLKAAYSTGGGNALLADYSAKADFLSVEFKSLASGGGNKITGYAWDFGDGNTSTDASPSHLFAGAGDFTVSLSVTDELGNKNTTERLHTIIGGNAAPTAAFSFTTDGLTVTLTGESSDPDGTIASYSWDFGD